MEIFCFLLGILFSYTHHPVLPLLAAAFVFICRKWPIVLFYLSGMLLAIVHQWWVLPVGIPNKALINNALVQGTIASMPQVNRHKTQFIIQ
jgi:competence protein ComEC